MKVKKCTECKWPIPTEYTSVRKGIRVRERVENHLPGCSIGGARIDQMIRKRDARIAIVERWWAKVSQPYRDKHRAPPAALKAKYLADLKEAKDVPAICA